VERRRRGSRARELGLVKRVTERLVSSLDFHEALATLLDGATELLGVERGSLLLVDDASRTLRIEVARGIDPAVVARTRIPVGHGIAGTVAASGEPIVAEDIRQLPFYHPHPLQEGDYADFSAICVPLTLHGRVLGVMNFNHKKSRRPFYERDLEFALLIANQASVVLWSAQLHGEYLRKQVLDRELEIARAIQERLLPQELPEVPGYRFAARCEMCSSVGGDYYDVVPLVDGRVAVVMGDAAGHGVGSALVAADARGALRESLVRFRSLEETLARVNDRLQSDTSAEMYMTLMVGVLDPATGTFEFVNAGHHMPLLVRDGSLVRLAPVGSNIPIGIRRGIRFGVEEPIRLQADDLLLLFTDGIWEATDAAGNRFGNHGLEETLVAAAAGDERSIIDALLDRAREFRGGGEADDDLTLLLVRAAPIPAI